ncbi:hypothetical protein FDT66_01015 [Polaribacter aestuariivivens]|uniref:Lipoprotein n=1 Tax=Polaribacter aestuariivivens TaxID=2304626 RepID=A0A5S3NAD8_9FLAO|nr:hypothetical protein [Polaribacter aestuariivivens]TMM32077.1 hypothetical protein FDT66_01015 [Polaribacter aestuariivivens]
MKSLKLFTLALLTTFAFSSCSNNETLLPEAESAKLLKSYKVKRDAKGSYSVDYNLPDNVRTETILNDKKNISEVYLYASEEGVSRRESQDLVIDGNTLKVSFVDTNVNNNPYLLIEDDNISLAKGKNENMLSEYSVSANEDGTFTLDFEVNKNVKVDFVYNEELNIHEVHLEAGKTSKTTYNRTLTKEERKVLRIDFVNHMNAQSKSASKEELTIRRKPRVAVDNGESGENQTTVG